MNFAETVNKDYKLRNNVNVSMFVRLLCNENLKKNYPQKRLIENSFAHYTEL